MNFFVTLALFVASAFLVRALTSKPPSPKAASLDDFQVPTAEYGRPIPWLFGTRKIRDGNCIWYGDLKRKRHKSSSGIFFRYSLGIHYEYCIGPVDALLRLQYGEKEAWAGDITQSQQFVIDRGDLYGGQKKEGGIAGTFDIMFGEEDQAVNDYLAAQLGTPLTAYRDSFTIVGRQPYLIANSTYVRALQPTAQRIFAGWPDDDVWFPETAAIVGAQSTNGGGAYDKAASLLDYRWHLDSPFSTIGDTEDHVGRVNKVLEIKREELSPLEAQPGIAGLQTGPVICSGDGKGVAYTRYVSRRMASLTIPYFIDGSKSFTFGVWIDNFSPAYEGTAIFSSNVDSDGARYVGMNLEAFLNGQLMVNFGDPSGGGAHDMRRTYVSAVGVLPPRGGLLPDAKGEFFVVSCRLPFWSFPPSVNDFAIYYNGGYVPMTGGPSDGTWGNGSEIGWYDPRNGTATAKIGVCCKYHPGRHAPQDAVLDEVFLHESILSASQIRALWIAGSTCGRVMDMNPAHMVCQAWIQPGPLGMGAARAQIDDAGMRYAAQTAYDEGFGLSLLWSRTDSMENFVAEICRHADFLNTTNPRTGQMLLVPLRGDYDPDALPHLTEDDIVEVSEWEDVTGSEAVNTVKVTYLDRENIEQVVTYQNRALAVHFGEISETQSYPGIPTAELALRVAKREVKKRGPRAKGKIKVNRVGWDLAPGKCVKVSHTHEGIPLTIMRVTGWTDNALTDGAITLDVVQDIFAMPDPVVDYATPQSEWQEPAVDAVPPDAQTLMELPYWALQQILGPADFGLLADDAGCVAALSLNATALDTGVDIWTRIPPSDWALSGDGQTTVPGAVLDAALDYLDDTAIAIKHAVNLDDVQVGWLAQIGTDRQAELVRVTGVTATTIDLDRGVLDTVPHQWPADTTIYFLSPDATVWPTTSAQHIDADDVHARLQPDGEGDLNALLDIDITMAARQVRPYPPGDVQINGVHYPSWDDDWTELVITWAHRDRLDLAVIDFLAASSGPESGTTYTVEAYGIDVDGIETQFYQATGISGTTDTLDLGNDPVPVDAVIVSVRVWSVRGGYDSWQQVRIDMVSFLPPYGLAARYEA